uniref:Uncharacterized protein n=1 Tax=Nelumbo nucifera TaxID=4432 RepID=A0A822Z1Z1_NELNU|nr:TPA_asm: hypothetical protein HUJ06_012845 [Nelumbo nucifera]
MSSDTKLFKVKPKNKGRRRERRRREMLRRCVSSYCSHQRLKNYNVVESTSLPLLGCPKQRGNKKTKKALSSYCIFSTVAKGGGF